MRYKVLWVEDNAEADLFHYLSPVNVDGRFDLDIAVNATEAITRLNTERYDVVIMDSRIPSGNDEHWQRCEETIQQKDVNPIVRLGLEILKVVLNRLEIPRILPENQRPDKYCIFSIDPKKELTEGDENKILDTLIYEQKKVAMPRNVLLGLIIRSLQKQGLM